MHKKAQLDMITKMILVIVLIILMVSIYNRMIAQPLNDIVICKSSGGTCEVICEGETQVPLAHKCPKDSETGAKQICCFDKESIINLSEY